MKKFTFILSLLVVMVTTAMAQTFDATKQYRLKNVGTDVVYLNVKNDDTGNATSPVQTVTAAAEDVTSGG